jgi:hypothetical protein
MVGKICGGKKKSIVELSGTRQSVGWKFFEIFDRGTPHWARVGGALYLLNPRGAHQTLTYAHLRSVSWHPPVTSLFRIYLILSMPYDDSHRALVQAFFSRHVLTVNELKPLIAAIMSVAGSFLLSFVEKRKWTSNICKDMEQEFSASQITDGMVSEFIGDTNDQLSRFDFEIRSTRDQIDRSTIYVLVQFSHWPRDGAVADRKSAGQHCLRFYYPRSDNTFG